MAERERILLVDDNPTNLEVLYAALEQEGYELLVAQSGEVALDVAQEAQPALILLDINMPGMDGFETCRRLKEDAVTRDAVVLFLSARNAAEDKVRGLEAGAVDFVSKPFQFEEVLARVKTHMQTYQRERRLVAENEVLRSTVEEGNLDAAGAVALIAKGESGKVEFKSTLRWNLRANKPGREIENAVLKTLVAFLNSEGGTLFVGVQDDGTVLGLGNDGFPNNDMFLRHFKNLVREAIGLDFADHIHQEILSLDGGDVLVVRCLPTTDPVFFRREKEEHFFVRVGSATESLPPSQMLAYVDRRRAG